MITPDMIANERKRHFIGEILEVKNVVKTKELKMTKTEEVRIIDIYKRFCLVYNGQYCYSVKWADFLQKENEET